MASPDLNRCPGTLAEGFATYSPVCLRRLFDGRRISHILPYPSPKGDEAVEELFMENRQRISISGVQQKLSLLRDGNRLRLTLAGEQGEYILKPIPRDVRKPDQVPANEHLTMQIARQVFGLPTAENALIFFEDDTPAYITRRFDIRPEGGKLGVEDFATLSGKTRDNAGPDFKYASSYEEMAALLRQFVPAWKVEMEKFFRLVLFNYLFSNGDAHLKNFSLLESDDGDHLLSPAYDLMNTRIHVADTDFALHQGLFTDTYRSPARRRTGHPSQKDFQELARRIGIRDERLAKIMRPFMDRQPMVDSLIGRSFLREDAQKAYRIHYHTRRNYLHDQ